MSWPLEAERQPSQPAPGRSPARCAAVLDGARRVFSCQDDRGEVGIAPFEELGLAGKRCGADHAMAHDDRLPSRDHRVEPTVPADIAIVATPILFIYLIYRSVKQRATDDGAARREANDVPGWVGVVGPLVLLVVVLKYMHL